MILGFELTTFETFMRASEKLSELNFQVSILMGTKDRYRFLRTILIFVFPKISKIFDIPFIDAEASDFIVNVIRLKIYQNFFVTATLESNRLDCSDVRG